MFPSRYFTPSYFAPRYFERGVSITPPIPPIVIIGGGGIPHKIKTYEPRFNWQKINETNIQKVMALNDDEELLELLAIMDE